MATAVSQTNPTRDSDPLDRLRDELARPPYHAFLRPHAERADPESGTVVIALPFRPEFRRAPDGPGYHGGIIAALIDLAAHAAVAVKIGRMAPTIDLRIDYLRVASDTDLRATAKLLRAGRSIGLADVEVTDGDGRMIAVGRGTFSTRE
ncbi:MAG: hypothetical protein JWO51_4559 [Rhodospirillales bacterium]|nr:hypothetical protein [Rhodospirillales bacterium]